MAITVSPSTLSLTVGSFAQLTHTPASQSVRWTSENCSCCTVTRQGVVLAVGVGVTTVSARHAREFGFCTVSVTLPDQEPAPTIAPTAVLQLETAGSTDDLVVVSTLGSTDDDALVSGTLNWGDGNTDTITGPPADTYSHTYTAVGSYTIVLRLVDTDGLEAATSIIVAVTEAPTIPPDPPPDPDPQPVNTPPTATLEDVSGQLVGQVYTLAATGADAEGPLVSGSLNWGDGTTPTTWGASVPATLTHTYTNPGTFIATLTVTDAGGLSTAIARQLTVQAVPIPPPNVAPVAVLTKTAGTTAGDTFTVSTAGTLDSDGTLASGSIVWGDGSANTTWTGVPAASYPHVYATAGTYVATLRVVDDDGAATSKTLAITVAAVVPPPTPNVPPLAVLAHEAGSIAGDTFRVRTTGTQDSDGTLVSGSLNWGDGSAAITWTGAPAATYQRVYSTAGTRSVVLKVVDDDGAQGAVTITITATAPVPIPNQSPVAVLVRDLGTFAGDTFRVNTAGTYDPDGTLVSGTLNWGEGATVSWTGAPAATYSHVYATAGTRAVTLTVVDNNGASDVAVISITATTVIPPPPSGGTPHAFFDDLAARPDCQASYHLRSEAQLIARCATPRDFHYVYPSDPDPRGQDAAKLIIPSDGSGVKKEANRSSIHQLRVPIGGMVVGHTYLVIWDAWYGDEWRREIAGVQTHKAFQFDGPDRDGGHPKIWWQPTHSYYPNATYPVPTTDVARLSVRWFGQSMFLSASGVMVGCPAGPNVLSGSTSATPIRPYTQWNVKPERWTRHWQLIEFGTDPDPWRTAPPGTLMTLWAADEDRPASILHNRLQVTLWEPGCQQFWIEFNTSENTVKVGRPNLIAYFRNIVILKDVSFAGVTPLLIQPER